MLYHVDRFFAAVSVLASHGHIKQRLIKAYEDNLIDICADELPIPMNESFSGLRTQMYRVTPLYGEGPICASVRKMSIDEACECAATIVNLYRDIANQADSKPGGVPVDEQDRIGVPPFLVKSN